MTETYVGKHRAAHQDSYYADPETGMKLMIWTANHTSQYPIIQHKTTRKGKVAYKPRHGYRSNWFKLFLSSTGIKNFWDETIPASRYVTT